MHIYHDDNDWFIGESALDCYTQQVELVGDDATPEGEWRQVPEREDIFIRGDEGIVYRTAKEWIDIHGRGLLCSVDY